MDNMFDRALSLCEVDIENWSFGSQSLGADCRRGAVSHRPLKDVLARDVIARGGIKSSDFGDCSKDAGSGERNNIYVWGKGR